MWWADGVVFLRRASDLVSPQCVVVHNTIICISVVLLCQASVRCIPYRRAWRLNCLCACNSFVPSLVCIISLVERLDCLTYPHPPMALKKGSIQLGFKKKNWCSDLPHLTLFLPINFLDLIHILINPNLNPRPKKIFYMIRLESQKVL